MAAVGRSIIQGSNYQPQAFPSVTMMGPHALNGLMMPAVATLGTGLVDQFQVMGLSQFCTPKKGQCPKCVKEAGDYMQRKLGGLYLCGTQAGPHERVCALGVREVSS